MGIVGKNVFFNHPYDGKLTGTVKTEYIGLAFAGNRVASGAGGHINLDQKFPVTFYIIKTENKLYHIQASEILDIIE